MVGWKEKLGLATLIVAPTAYAAWLLFFPFSKVMVLPLVPAAALGLFKHFHPDAFFRRMAGSCFAVSAASVAVPAARLSYQAKDLKFGFAVEPGSVWVAAVGLLATVGFGVLELRRRSEGKQPQGPPPPNGGNTLNVTSGGKVEAGNIVFGDQHIHNDKTSGQALDAIEKLVDHGVLDAADDQLTALERTSWLSMVPAEKYRHRKLQGRVLGGRGQNAAAADRFMEAADFVPTDEKAQVLRAHALMMRGDLEGAHELSTRLVAQHPSLAAAKAAWITSATKSARADDLLGKPWDALAPEVASALADRLLDESRPKEALEVLQRAHSPGVKLGYWSTYSIALLKYHEQLGLENGPPELLTEAMTALEKANKLCAGESFKAGKVLICCSSPRLAAFPVDKSASPRPSWGGVEAGAKRRQCRHGGARDQSQSFSFLS